MSFSEEIKINALLNKKVRFGEYDIEYNDSGRVGAKKLHLWADGFGNLFYLFKKKIQLLLITNLH